MPRRKTEFKIGEVRIRRTLPKTNLFQGDRVRFSKSYITSMEILGTLNGPDMTNNIQKDRVGTIVSDTLHPLAAFIRVHWDGKKTADTKDRYMPDELELVEDDVPD
jgi:hypothetical protein